MRKIIVSQFITLDGVIQAPGDSKEDTQNGFTQGGWSHPYWHDDIGTYIFAGMAETDTLLLGRKTWQGHAAAFAPDPLNDPFGDSHKYVVSTTLTSAAAWRNSTIIRDNVVEQIRALKQQPGKNIHVGGSSVLMRTLEQHDLVDEYALLVYPIALGTGKRLFSGERRVDLKLSETKVFPTGVVLMRYQPQRG